MDISISPDPAEYYGIIVPPQAVVPRNEGALEFQNLKTVKRFDSNLAFWAVVDGVLLVFILGGNILTILAVRFSRRLRSVTSNMFVLSLAISDILVGFTLPYHLAFYIGAGLGKSKQCCLLRFFLIILACCNSVWNLIAIAFDRYIAIFYPLHYSRYMTKKVAIILLGFGWIVGATFAMIPMFWNNWDTATKCEFDEILKPWYVAGIITPGFSLVWVCMLIVYWRIWREATKHAKQLRSSFTGLHETPSDSKSVQVVLFILGCFSICWLPYFIVACAQIFKFFEKSTPMLYKGAFSLAMANSGMNPIIYAWKNTGFRRAFARLLRCKSPDHNDVTACSQHSGRSQQQQQQHRKSSAIQHQDSITAVSNMQNDIRTDDDSPLPVIFQRKHTLISKLKKSQQPISIISKTELTDTPNSNSTTTTLTSHKQNRRTSFASTVIINSSSSSLSSLVATPPPSANLERRLSNLVSCRKNSLTSSSSQPMTVVFLPEEIPEIYSFQTADKTEIIKDEQSKIGDKGEILKSSRDDGGQSDISIEKRKNSSEKSKCKLNNSLRIPAFDCQNMMIEQIECDGNGNTQIRISPKSSIIKLKKDIFDSEEDGNSFELKLSCKDFRQLSPSDKITLSQSDSSIRLKGIRNNGETMGGRSNNSVDLIVKQNISDKMISESPIQPHQVQIEQLCNGNHVVTKKKKIVSKRLNEII